MRSSRASLLCAVVLLAVVALVLPVGCGGKTKAKTTDTVVARVNGREIHRSQVDAARGQATLSQQTLTYQQALNATIDEELVRQEAQRLRVAVTDAAVDSRLAQVQSSVGDEKEFESYLKSSGLTKAALRGRIAIGLLEERVGQVKFPGQAATVKEARTFYDGNLSIFTNGPTVKLGDIVLKTQGLALSVLGRLRKGEDFSQTARQFTRDPAGGQLGWVLVSSLPKELAAAVAKLKPGQLTEPVVSLGGVHVVKLYARRHASVVPFSQARAQIVAELSRQHQQAALLQWLVGARAAADIKILK